MGRKKALKKDFDRRPSQVTISNQVITHSISRQNNHNDDNEILVEIEDFDDQFAGHQKPVNFQPLRRYSSDFSLCELPDKEKKIWTQNPFKIIFLKLKYFCFSSYYSPLLQRTENESNTNQKEWKTRQQGPSHSKKINNSEVPIPNYFKSYGKKSKSDQKNEIKKISYLNRNFKNLTANESKWGVVG